MNRQISYNWLKEYIKSTKPLKELAKELSLKSMSVERIIEKKPTFAGVVTAKIIAIQKHPNADKLRLATAETGQGKQTVVCGAPNIEVGQIVPLAKEGAILHQDGDQFKINKANIRGVESRGMLCSQKELGIGDDHTGIMILPAETPLGRPLENILPLSDYILDIEITSNRPDVMSVIGLARETAAASGSRFNYQEPKPNLKKVGAVPLSVEIAELKICPRYQAVVMTGITVVPSPLWMQFRLLASGIRPINNLVDITNYILLEYGQPMHVFDYEKLAGVGQKNNKKIIVRKAKSSEKILALDGNVYNLNSDQLVIADIKGPVAVAGVMGGQDSAVDNQTKTIVFEAANFNPVSVRKTARALNLHSESSDLFEKALHPASTKSALLRAVELTQKLADGKIASGIIDAGKFSNKKVSVNFNPENIKRYLGIDIKIKTIKDIFSALGFSVTGSKTLKVSVPWWRQHDIEFEHDLVEEVARIYGYHNLPAELPVGSVPVVAKNQQFYWEKEVKAVLVGLGFAEVYNYSMVSKSILSKTGFDAGKCLKISNPLNEELEYMRPTLLSHILQNVSDNTKNFSEQKIFELSNVYLPVKSNDLPEEKLKLTGAIVSDRPFFDIKGLSALLLKKLGIKNCQIKPTDQKCPLWQPGQAMDVYSGDKFLGQFGLVSDKILMSFGLDRPIAIIDFDLKTTLGLASTNKNYQPLPEFPSAERDLAVIVDKNVSWQEISDLVSSADKLIESVEYLSTFIDISIGADKKSLAFRLVFRLSDRTLKSEEVSEAVKKIITKLEEKFKAKLR